MGENCGETVTRLHRLGIVNVPGAMEKQAAHLPFEGLRICAGFPHRSGPKAARTNLLRRFHTAA